MPLVLGWSPCLLVQTRVFELSRDVKVQCNASSWEAAFSSDWPLQLLRPCASVRQVAVVGRGFFRFFTYLTALPCVAFSFLKKKWGEKPPYFYLATEGALIQKTPWGIWLRAQFSSMSLCKVFNCISSWAHAKTWAVFWRILSYAPERK